jgi:hypothetical protein
MQEQGAKTIQELDYLHFDGPFQFCRRKLGSKIRRCHASVYDVSRDTVGGDGFDLVFLGDVLPHLFSPLGALVAVAPLCRGTLVLYQGLTALCETHPALFYVGGERPTGDRRSWWAFNLQSLEQMLRRMGFARVTVVGEVRGTVRGEWIPYERAVIHATR